MKQTLKVNCNDASITRRARHAVNRLVKDGHHIDEIAKTCNTTVVSLIDGDPSTLKSEIHFALAEHYRVNLLWLWTGNCTMFLKFDPEVTFA